MGMLDRVEAYERIDRYFLRQVRDCMKLIVAHELEPEALRLCKVIRARDLYIGAPPPPVTYFKSITLRHPGMCQSTRCGQALRIGDAAIWQESVGVWHPRCWVQEQEDGDGTQQQELI